MATVREMRDLGDEDLIERLESSKEELFNLRFQLATGQLDNPMRIKQVRHDVARILTILRERDLGRVVESPPAAGTAEPATSDDVAAPDERGTKRRRLRRAPKESTEQEES